MNLSRLVASFLPILISGALVTADIPALDVENPRAELNWAGFYHHHFDAAIPQPSEIYGHFVTPACEVGVLTCIVPTPTDGGIKEDIPAKYRDRYEKWKTELLSTDWGRSQWERYANDTTFVLKIVVTGDRKRGAGTDKLQWDDTGRFVGATITLGANLDEGFPNPIYYPVLNSLSPDTTTYAISGRLLAATKISHEIGHVNQAAKANMKFLQLQNSLMPVYNSIFLKNGLNTKDSKLMDLASQMGGTPVEIWESREYWSEVNAMLFLDARINKEAFYCHVFNKIKRNIESYARDYEAFFEQHPEFARSSCWK